MSSVINMYWKLS